MNAATRAGGSYLAPSAVSSDWQVASVADFNADGQRDLLWHHQPSGALYVWFMNGTTRIGGRYLTPSSVPSDWQIKGVADFNADGQRDLLWHHQPSGALQVWFMNGTTRIGGGYLHARQRLERLAGQGRCGFEQRRPA